MQIISGILAATRLELIPVRVRGGIAKGAVWTLYPWTSYWRGTHEPLVQQLMMTLGGGDIRGWSCWDVGAHFGLYSIGLARRVGSTGQVAAFEPNPRSFDRLRRHRRMNRLAWLKLYPAAASDHADGSELFTYGNLDSTTTHLRYDGESRASNVGALPVETVPLDALVASGELRLPMLVKIDAEGHGHRVLGGMRNALAQARPIIVASMHSPEERAGMVSILNEYGYAGAKVGEPSSHGIEIGANYHFTAEANLSRRSAKTRVDRTALGT